MVIAASYRVYFTWYVDTENMYTEGKNRRYDCTSMVKEERACPTIILAIFYNI